MSVLVAKTILRFGGTQLQMGDIKECQNTCEELLKRFANSPYDDEVNTVAWLCALSPNSVQSYERLIGIVEPIVTRADLDQSDTSYLYLNTLGALQFRAGNWEEAMNLLERSRQVQARKRDRLPPHDVSSDFRQSKSAVAENAPPNSNRLSLSDDIGTIWDWLFLAMTCKELGDSASAEKWLKQSRDRFEFEVGDSWQLRVELELLLAEATQRVNDKSP